MLRMLVFKHSGKDSAQNAEEEGEVEECPMKEGLQDALREFHEHMCRKIVGAPSEQEQQAVMDLVAVEDGNNWVDKLAGFVVPIPPPPPVVEEGPEKKGLGNEIYVMLVLLEIFH